MQQDPVCTGKAFSDVILRNEETLRNTSKHEITPSATSVDSGGDPPEPRRRKAQTAAPTERPSDAVIRGRVIDPSDAPVAGAAVVLFNRDSVYLDAVASDADGRFEIRSAVRPYRLQFQHIAYEVRTIESDRTDLGDIRLTEASTKVAAVVVEGERPVVKVEQGRLDYDLGRLTEGQAVNNAYEALTRLPGVMEQEGALTLAGASSVTVILNGRPRQ